VTSADGCTIAYQRSGGGPPVVLVTGAFNDRNSTAELAEQLGSGFTVYRYDRRGRGGSDDQQPYAVEARSRTSRP
jgi:pimeloyl-ACP methyl ester carboxylesterase